MQRTEKYFEQDAFRTQCESTILAAEPDEKTGGGRIALDGTVFYPEGGGQPADRGTLTLPDGTGFEFCKRVRQVSKVPIIFLTASDEETSIIMGLDMGGDDYITKPFGTGELLARVRAALRVNRYGGGSLPGGVFSAQGLTINYERRKVFVDGQEVRLTQTEYNIVAFLSEHAGRVMTYAAIVRAIWGDTDASSTKKLQVNMANIRKKLGSRPGSNTYILNELGVGYRMIEEDAKPLEPAEETK